MGGGDGLEGLLVGGAVFGGVGRSGIAAATGFLCASAITAASSSCIEEVVSTITGAENGEPVGLSETGELVGLSVTIDSSTALGATPK